MKIHAFPDSEDLGGRVAKLLRASFAMIAVHQFPDRETLVRIARPPGRQAVTVLELRWNAVVPRYLERVRLD